MFSKVEHYIVRQDGEDVTVWGDKGSADRSASLLRSRTGKRSVVQKRYRNGDRLLISVFEPSIPQAKTV